MIRGIMGSLWRRWYITFPGLLLAGLMAFGAWKVIPPTYQRSASEFLVPGLGSLPENANPFLYLGGLSQAADVLVVAVGSDNVAREIESAYPGSVVQVSRDPTTAGPVILITVDSRSDADAAQIVDILLARTRTELETLQARSSVPSSQQITVRTLTVDQQGTIRPRTRLVTAGGVLAGTAILAIFVAVFWDGLANRRQPRRDLGPGHDEAAAPTQLRNAAEGAGTSDLPVSADPDDARPSQVSDGT